MVDEPVPALRGGRFASGAGSLAVTWSIIAAVFGLYMAPVIAVIGSDHGTYCESIDHASPCPNLVPGMAYSLVALVGGSWSFAASVGLRRGRPKGRQQVVVALSVTATAMCALGVWAAIEDEQTRLSAPGRFFLLVVVVSSSVCVLLVSLVTRSPTVPVAADRLLG
jgi:hypothetical protein